MRQEDDNGDSSESGESSLDEGGDMDEAEVEEKVELMAVMVERAREHVSSYQVQRNNARKLINLACLGITDLLPSLVRQKFLTIDMGQNLCSPNF